MSGAEERTVHVWRCDECHRYSDQWWNTKDRADNDYRLHLRVYCLARRRERGQK